MFFFRFILYSSHNYNWLQIYIIMYTHVNHFEFYNKQKSSSKLENNVSPDIYVVQWMIKQAEVSELII